MMTLNTGREYIPCVCSGCENEAICKYTEDVVKAEKWRCRSRPCSLQ